VRRFIPFYLDQWEGGNGAETFCRQPRAFARTDNLEREFMYGSKPNTCGDYGYCVELTSAALWKNHWRHARGSNIPTP
jgi:hypothetical protein